MTDFAVSLYSLESIAACNLLAGLYNAQLLEKQMVQWQETVCGQQNRGGVVDGVPAIGRKCR